ncbi:helix-turn-helix domain-containing protein [Beijerinckia indica]|uniref:Transcriptional regulator, XRE family n=1 Tax=Beijerinckia indica subsp. indica (strain ATCC 9039 / DSM 1715 / NCIMB 8712) TaxID=395963 RepID=B2IC57_BEII9|nr:helix-turn-helix transcriptional regulator [Beijerinckia indica]ACB95312.1 transcriptional regulator, XRE family [Beijerinckia indica subsp. indica ATCC 9039]
MAHQIIMTPGGEKLVLLPFDEFQALRDAADAAAHVQTLAALAHGEEERLTPAEALALAEAATPLAFWRRKRGLTQTVLAERAGISQSALAGMESGARVGTAAVLARVAKALHLHVEDLITVDE